MRVTKICMYCRKVISVMDWPGSYLISVKDPVTHGLCFGCYVMIKTKEDLLRKAIKITKVSLLVVATIVIVYDVVIGPVLGHWEATVSNITYWAGLRLVFIPFAWGVLTAHFWLSKLGRRLFGIGKWRYVVWITIGILILVVSLLGRKLNWSILLWMANDNLWLPLAMGTCTGLLWAQEKPKEVVE